MVLRLDGVARPEARSRAGPRYEALGDPGRDVAADPRVLGELDHRDRPATGEPVAGRDERDEGVADERGDGVAGTEGLARVVGDDVDVDGRRLPGRIALGEDHLEDEVGHLCLEPLGQAGHPQRPGRREVADGQRAGVALAQVGDDRLDALRLSHEALALGGEGAGGRGRLDPPAGALEEGEPRLLLQCAEVLAHSAAGHAEVVRGRADRAAGHDGQEDSPPVEVDHATQPISHT